MSIRPITYIKMQTQSKLATVMSQLFPMFVGTVTLSVKEIVANKELIINALQHLADTKRGGTKFLSYCEDKGLVPQHSEYYTERNSIYAYDSSDMIWKWFSDNFLSLTFVKGEGQHFSEHPIHHVICVATAITKLYSRLRMELTVTEEEQDIVHSLKYRFEHWGVNSQNQTEFIIGLDEISIIQRLLQEYNADTSWLSLNLPEERFFWINETAKRINLNILGCLEYVNTLV
jgi:hypothetical protein